MKSESTDPVVMQSLRQIKMWRLMISGWEARIPQLDEIATRNGVTVPQLKAVFKSANLGGAHNAGAPDLPARYMEVVKEMSAALNGSSDAPSKEDDHA